MTTLNITTLTLLLLVRFYKPSRVGILLVLKTLLNNSSKRCFCQPMITLGFLLRRNHFVKKIDVYERSQWLHQ